MDGIDEQAIFIFGRFAALFAFYGSASAQEDRGRPLKATLTGAAEVPGPGNPDGTGTATIRLNQGKGEVCYEITVSNIAAPTLAHIHRGPWASKARRWSR